MASMLSSNNRMYCSSLVLLSLGAGLVQAAGAVSETESVLRERIAWQVALDGLGFSPGLIDGRVGLKTQIATREFQRVHGLPVTGQLDKATGEALKIAPNDVIGRYTIQQADLDEVGPLPKGWLAKSKLSHLGHESLGTVLGEKFHCAQRLLETLNPGRDVNGLQPGDTAVVPILSEVSTFPRAEYLEINLAEKIIRVIDRDKKLVALFHCSVAADKAKLPAGQARVACIVQNPTYTFDPDMWPEVTEKVPGPLTIPPGRDPVGRCWIGLSLPGYGMHGTPNPELIGKTGSHGCFRLAHWDAIRLSKMVRVGTPVHFVSGASLELASRK